MIKYTFSLVVGWWFSGGVEQWRITRLSHVKSRYYDVDNGGEDAHSEDHIIAYVGYILIFRFVDVECRA